MNHLLASAVAGTILIAGLASASAAAPAAPAWVSHNHVTTPATPSARPAPAPLFSLFGVPVTVQAPVRAPYSTSLFQTIPGQDGNDRTFPAGPPTQYAE